MLLVSKLSLDGCDGALFKLNSFNRQLNWTQILFNRKNKVKIIPVSENSRGHPHIFLTNLTGRASMFIYLKHLGHADADPLSKALSASNGPLFAVPKLLFWTNHKWNASSSLSSLATTSDRDRTISDNFLT